MKRVNNSQQPTFPTDINPIMHWRNRIVNADTNIVSKLKSTDQTNLIEHLRLVWRYCNQENWDGFGALAVPVECFHMASAVIQSFPPGFPKPDFGAEPDGELTMEWHQSPHRTISISVTKHGLLHYSAIFGQKSYQNGTEEFQSKLPDNLISLIHRVLRHENMT